MLQKSDTQHATRFGAALWLHLLVVTLSLTACTPSGSGTAVDSDKEKAYQLSEPIPLPGNHDQRVLTVSASQPETRDPPGDAGANDAAGMEEAKPRRLTEFDPENLRVKPGHWIAVQSEGKSNEADFNGVLQYSMRKGNGRPAEIQGTRYFLRSTRPAPLAKEQSKIFETPVFVGNHVPLLVLPELISVSGGRMFSEAESFRDLKPYQYHMVLLTDSKESYRYLTVLPTIRNVRLTTLLGDLSGIDDPDPADAFGGGGFATNFGGAKSGFGGVENGSPADGMFYKLTISDWGNRVELPSNVQQWSSIAYLIWSDFPPERFSPEQQQALMDWLHLGGQLIVSGDALDALNQSFLKPYLPVAPSGSANALASDLLPMFEHWSLALDSNGQKLLPSFGPQDTFVNKTWTVHPEANPVPETEGYVIERPIGQGRMVAVSFPLNLPKLRSWSGMDNWFNACLLRRPGRHFTLDDIESEFSFSANEMGFAWRILGLQNRQPSIYSNFRIASRDWASRDGAAVAGNPEATPDEDAANQRLAGTIQTQAIGAVERRFAEVNLNASAGAWDDYSGLAQAARTTMKDQAGITPPRRDWVLKALLAYLAVLVPVNYLLFKFMGRPEWAWFFIPVIAVGGAIAVVRAASLDIGFSNKRLQLNVIEIPHGYSRGHLTGYGSLYSSLTTQFRFQSENATTLALPFPASTSRQELPEEPSAFEFEFGKEVKFGPQQVLSNTMEMYQFQQMVEVGGAIRFEQDSEDLTPGSDRTSWLNNGSRLELKDVVLLHHAPGQGLRWAYLAQCDPAERVALSWEAIESADAISAKLQATRFADSEFQVTKLFERMRAAEVSPLENNWETAVAFFDQSEPEFAKALRRLAEQKSELSDKLSMPLMRAAVKESMLADEINLGQLFRVASRYVLGPDEMRLIAWTDNQIDQWQVTPKVSQQEHSSLVLQHLRLPQLPPLSKDTNLAYPPKTQKSEADIDSTDDPVMDEDF